MVLLLVTLGLSFTGYLLPWDQLAFWAVTIGTSMAEKAPVGGQEANLLLRGAATIGPNGLLRFYLLHVIFLPAIGSCSWPCTITKSSATATACRPAWKRPAKTMPAKSHPTSACHFCLIFSRTSLG